MATKKQTILYILEILKESSDETHPLTYHEIIAKLNSIYSIDCERKSVANNINSLIDFGYDIVRIDGGGCYLNEREFEKSEITILIDSVFSSKNIPANHAKDLTNKLSKLLSVNDRKRFQYVHKGDEISRSANQNFFYNIDIINEAIDSRRKVTFKYNYYDENGLTNRKDKVYKINPYFMLSNNGKYYVVCNLEGKPGLSNYKLDHITEIELSEENITPIHKLKNYENGIDIARYANENIYMFGDEAIEVTLKLNNELMLNNLIEWFGENVNIYKKEEEGKKVKYAVVKVSENSIIYWSLQYGMNVEIMAPDSTRKKIGDMAKIIADKYMNEL